jgi:fructose-1,6-bisphosphatase
VNGGSTADRASTLTEHVRAAEGIGPSLASVLEALAEAGARLAGEIARAPLTNALGETGAINPHGDRVRRLDILANDLLLAALQRTGVVSVVASEELSTPVVWPRVGGVPGFAVCLDPLDGSLNSDVAGVTGTIFGIWPGPAPGAADPARVVLGAGTRQVAAGYLVYGATTVFVYAAGTGAHAFVHDPADGRFRLTQERVRTPTAGRTYAVNDANWPHWGPAPRAVVEELRRAASGEGGRYALRYSGALAADFHRTLLEGGIYLYPEDAARPGGRIRLLYEAAPLALVAEAAGGGASTGRGRILDVIAEDYHQRTPVYIGSRAEVGWAERCHRESPG